MASKDKVTDPEPTELDTAKSHLLKLPPELRNRIFELVLSAAPKCYISKLTRPHKPGLLQLNRQIRADTKLMYYALKHFIVLFKPSTFSVIQNWIDTVTTAELRSIESVTFKFDLDEVMHDLNILLTRKFVQLLWRLYGLGLARSAVRVFYVASMSDDRDQEIVENVLNYVVYLHDRDDRVMKHMTAGNTA